MQPEKTYRQRKRRWPLPRERWRVSAKLSRLLPFALTLMAVLCCASCATTKKTQTEQIVKEVMVEKHDTVTVIKQTHKETVPMSQARITISVDSLLKLPAGASYHKRSGQAGAEVSLKGDTIFVTATCDSLQREVEYYEEQYHATLEALDNLKERVQTEREHRSTAFNISFESLPLLVAVAVLSITIFKFTIRWIK